LVENDDPGNPNTPLRAGLFGIASKTPDSLIDIEAKADADLHVEITDHFGDGGPEYAYRLATVATYPAFAIKLLLANPNAFRQYVSGGERPAFVTGSGVLGALNLKPGEVLPINFLVTSEGRPGRITVRAEGMPPASRPSR
jgi:hypothetical protein